MSGGGHAALRLSTPAPSDPSGNRKPPRLRPGDVVGLVEPAKFTPDRFQLNRVVDTIEAMGLKARLAPHLTDRYGYLAGEDAARAADLTAMYADAEVRAVFAVRGGWGSARTLPYLDWETIRANPKLLVGYSDITSLHLAFQRVAGFPTLHAPIAAASWPAYSWEAFRSVAFEGATPVYSNPAPAEDRLARMAGSHEVLRPGRARGRLIGGNLTVLTSLVGTPYLPDMSGAILFLEDVDEPPYRLDRMMTQLALAGILRAVAGVVFGQCTDCTPGGESYGGFTVMQVLDQHLTPLGIPAFAGAQFGHVARQWTLPLGVEAEMDAQAGTLTLLEPAVS
ncbi:MULTISPECIES: S66 peptidase family protein [Pacificimonas]|uniref:S66 peptidase family protein n=1 Tax=Pacificimonas TaxID=1960290 RepID=UPI0021E1A461